MKKIFILSLLTIPFFVTSVHAETVSLKELNLTNFDLNVSDITYYKDIKKTQFNVHIENIVNPQNIAYWKIRTYCDKKMVIQTSILNINDCNKAVRLDSLADNAFSFLFGNETSRTKDFSIKLKAYDRKGKGLHFEKIGFGWK